MPKKVTMPRLDKDMMEGLIAVWLRSEGDRIEKGEVLFEIETDKAAVEVEAPDAGSLHHIAVQAGGRAPVDSVVAWLYAEGEEVGPAPAAEPTPAPSTTPAVALDTPLPGPDHAAPAPASITGLLPLGRHPITPAARAEARRQGLSLSRVIGTGPGARIQKSDILAAARAIGAAKDATPVPVHPQAQAGPLSVISNGGGDRLPMVMIHGFLADASGWDNLAKPLARNRRIHRIELPCHGRSPLRIPRDFAQLAAELRQAFDGLNIDRAHLVGHSLGGALALALADTRPRQIASLTLISPAGLGPEINGPALLGMCRASRSESLGPWMKLLTSDPDAIGWSYVQAAAMTRRDPALRVAQEKMADALFPDGVQAFDLRAAMERVKLPARIVWGRDDQIIPWRHALNAPGHFSLNLFRAAGHMPHYEISEAIEPLLATLP